MSKDPEDVEKCSKSVHSIRIAGNKTPLAIYQISREKAINRGESLDAASDPLYGHDPHAPLPPLDELQSDLSVVDYTGYPDIAAERDARITLNGDDEVEECKDILKDIDYLAEDGNSGIDIYCQAVLTVTE
ncbi:hypothetical protein C8J57DRAFT_1240863 [Mycena rebaudengoi]|nr:hypothetical protein C8J57DRAFT_1240863 [Mycena rebaudengoi]